MIELCCCCDCNISVNAVLRPSPIGSNPLLRTLEASTKSDNNLSLNPVRQETILFSILFPAFVNPS